MVGTLRCSGRQRGMPLVTHTQELQAEQRRGNQWHPQVLNPVSKRAPHILKSGSATASALGVQCRGPRDWVRIRAFSVWTQFKVQQVRGASILECKSLSKNAHRTRHDPFYVRGPFGEVEVPTVVHPGVGVVPVR
jgi:hypothetical protein